MMADIDWPEPVDFKNEPEKGKVHVLLTIDEMEAKKEYGLVGPYKDDHVQCEWKEKGKWLLWLDIKVTDKKGNIIKRYEYRHKMRKAIDPDLTDFKIATTKKIALRIAKANTLDDWSNEAIYLTTNQAELTPIEDEDE